MLTNSSGTNYVLNEHEDVGQYGPYVILSEVMPCYRYLASLLDQFEILIDSSCLMSSSESDYVPNEHEDVDKYGWFAIPSEKMLC